MTTSKLFLILAFILLLVGCILMFFGNGNPTLICWSGVTCYVASKLFT